MGRTAAVFRRSNDSVPKSGDDPFHRKSRTGRAPGLKSTGDDGGNGDDQRTVGSGCPPSCIIDEEKRLTAAALLRDILYRSTFRRGETRFKEYPIVIRAQRIAKRANDVDVRIAADRIEEYFDVRKTEDRQRRFVRQIIERSLAELRSPEWGYLSTPDGDKSVYSGIIHGSRVVTVAVGQASPSFQRSMTTLVKSLFQQAVLADLSHRTGSNVPFFILACDEYAQAITEGETGLVSDSRFFSLSREAGCMSLLALQSVATGRSRFPAAMHDRWDGILGNVTVKFFMRVNDVETARFAGVSRWTCGENGGAARPSPPLIRRGMPPLPRCKRRRRGLLLPSSAQRVRSARPAARCSAHWPNLPRQPTDRIAQLR